MLAVVVGLWIPVFIRPIIPILQKDKCISSNFRVNHHQKDVQQEEQVEALLTLPVQSKKYSSISNSNSCFNWLVLVLNLQPRVFFRWWRRERNLTTLHLARRRWAPLALLETATLSSFNSSTSYIHRSELQQRTLVALLSKMLIKLLPIAFLILVPKSQAQPPKAKKRTWN